ncbi:hypothetical protein Snoj_35490 [Streptomyces nojiriensis]|uniref:LRV domain-containing protein n=1 Tax=Streptomyces nojiriensis TaxID=66374 RepID=A0ABQ3SNC8_9ACTN|nr:hypothetical protein [Streptomyces nojiriensis]QTI43188.1 hypothetical protein JYK04_00950 [Streptomyces nojiriensis]GGS31309.1 hypothetical protein GCM10010205_71930 [Streptomyces nojiriensis]GHI69631.1 hypothetical protein Snoj_35490 [Streptomyces nojiriensis]
MPNSPSALEDLWSRGVAANTGAPAGVLLRLLDPAAGEARRILCAQRSLPQEVMDAAVAHPDAKVRRSFARNPHVPAAQRARLAEDPHCFVRAQVASGPHPRPRRPRPLPDEALIFLLTAEEGGDSKLLTANEIAQELVFSYQIPASFRRRMQRHAHPALRIFAAQPWSWLTPEHRRALLADPHPDVRASAERSARTADPAAMEAELPEHACHHRWMILNNYALSDAVVEACLADPECRWSLAGNPYTPRHAFARLARDVDPKVRERVAGRADLDPALWAALAEDPDERVRTRARVQPLPRTRAQCQAVDHEMGRCAYDCDCYVLEPCEDPDPDWYRACAVSEEVLLRRAAARYAGLPADLVLRLAEDPDEEVRHRLASWHPLAPAAIVLAAFVARPAQRPHLLMQSRLPRTGLAHLLGHEDPEVRALAAADPTGRAPVELLTDPDEHVRRAAAANPLFSRDTLETLLRDPATAEGAAANPGLPAVRLHALLDSAHLPR